MIRRISQSRITHPETEKEETHPPDEVSKYLAEIGRRGGLKGGKARAAKLTPEERTAIGQRGAKARWSRERNKSTEE